MINPFKKLKGTGRLAAIGCLVAGLVAGGYGFASASGPSGSPAIEGSHVTCTTNTAGVCSYTFTSPMPVAPDAVVLTPSLASGAIDYTLSTVNGSLTTTGGKVLASLAGGKPDASAKITFDYELVGPSAPITTTTTIQPTTTTQPITTTTQPITTTTVPSTGGAPAVPAALQICASPSLQSPWSGSGVPSGNLTGGGMVPYTSGQYAGLPTFGSAGTDFPSATSGKIVAAGNNGGINYQGPSGTLYWFAPGTHTIGTSSFNHIVATTNSVYVGGYNGSFATVDGQNLNEFGISGTVTGVTVEYMAFTNIRQGSGDGKAISNDGLGRLDTSWVVKHNWFHDFGIEGGGNAQGVGFFGNGQITYNCFQRLGQAGINFFGKGGLIDHNEFDGIATFPDGGGMNAAAKGWETTNWTISNNYVHNTEYGYGIWLDTENTGYHITGNFFAWNLLRSIEIEISENGSVDNNTFVYNGFGTSGGYFGDKAQAIDFNVSGAADIPGSNYNNQILVQNNNLYDNWEGISIFAEADRTCLQPQPPANYCTSTDKASFGHASGAQGTVGGDGGGQLTAACNGATTACSTLSVNYQYPIGDKIGFANGTYPYTVTARTGSSPDSLGPPDDGSWTITVSPPVNVGEASGAQVWSAGTCPLYDSATATPASPTPASLGHGSQTISYFDGCQWRARNFTVEGNTIHFSPTEVQALANTTPPWESGSWTYGGVTSNPKNCYSGTNYLDLHDSPPTGNSFKCGMNSMYGSSGSPVAPYNQPGSGTAWLNNAVMSNSSFPSPLNNLDTTANGGLGEGPGNNLWTANTYDGPIGFRTYADTISATSMSSPPYACGSAIAGFQPVCDVTVAGWASIWHQG